MFIVAKPIVKYQKLPKQNYSFKRKCLCTAAYSPEVDGKIKMVGMGSACVDYLVGLQQYPKPDEKVRTESFQVQGGGNCGNAVSGAAKLGLQPYIITKIGDDSIGDNIIREFEDVGVKTDFVVRGKNSPSPFTYIIVDKQGGSRTCIHTPSEPLGVDELKEANIKQALEGSKLIYFDGRLTEAAIPVAQMANQLNIPVLVEAERLRPNLDGLLQYADYVFASSHFPFDFTGEQCRGDALISMVSKLPNAKLIANTFGSKGSLVLEKTSENSTQQLEQKILDDTIEDVIQNLNQRLKLEGSQSVACTSSTGVQVREGLVEELLQPTIYCKKYGDEGAQKQQERLVQAAAQEAVRSGGSGSSYTIIQNLSGEKNSVQAKLYFASSAILDKESVIDTTGAGDSFLASICYGLCVGKDVASILKLASVVAGVKCTVVGARGGQPCREQFQQQSLL